MLSRITIAAAFAMFWVSLVAMLPALPAQEPDERPKLKKKSSPPVTPEPKDSEGKTGSPTRDSKTPPPGEEEAELPERAPRLKPGDIVVTDREGRMIDHRRATGEKAAPEARQNPPERSSSAAKAPPALLGENPAPSRRSAIAAVPGSEEFWEEVAETTYQRARSLPDFLVDQITYRHEGERRNPRWRMKDRVTAEVAFVSGKEEYRNLRVNGKLVKGNPEESGTWSTGEFGTLLLDLLSPSTKAKFKYYRDQMIGRTITQIYDFQVRKENSHWDVRIGGYGIRPAYQGSVWVNPQTKLIHRVEMESVGLPQDYPADSVEMAIDFGPVKIAGQEYHMPLKAEVLSCQRSSPHCSRNEIEFRNYRKFGAESIVITTDSTITFEEEPAAAPPTASPKKPASKKQD